MGGSPIEQHTRDVVVIGASAGGLDAIGALVAGLGPELPGSLFVAQHMSASSDRYFVDLLQRRTGLRVEYPNHGQPIERGRIYVSPPDVHLTLRYGAMQVTRGAKENGHRPSVDALFRSAARAYGPRVIGVVLTGYLDCGTAGLLSIKARAGLAIAQDPAEAVAPEMPRSAIEHVGVDHVAGLGELPALLLQRMAEPAPHWAGEVAPAIQALEGDREGEPAALSCPSCQGVLSEAEVGTFHQFRCHVGHTFSLESVLAEQTEETERALWSAVRALEESAALAERVGLRSSGDLQQRFAERHRVLKREAELVRQILIGRRDSGVLTSAAQLERNQPG